MKMKKLLLLAFIIKFFSVVTPVFAMDGGASNSWMWNINQGVGIVSGLATMAVGLYTHWNGQEVHAHNVENHKLDVPTKIQAQNTSYLASFKEMHMTLTEAAKRKKSDKKIEQDLKANEKSLRNYRAFVSLGLFDKEVFDPTKTYEAKDLSTIEADEKKETNNKKTNVQKEPGFFRKTANAARKPFILAQLAFCKAADTLSVNTLLGRMAEHESLKGTFFDRHKRNIGGALVAATTAALIYKMYSWYYNEERIAAGQSVIELEEQAKMITEQYKQEMKRTDLSKEDKVKLKKACMQYMKQLKENIQQQKIVAGYNVYRNLLVTAVIAAVGLPMLIKYYPDELKKMFLPQEPQETSAQPIPVQEIPKTNEPIPITGEAPGLPVSSSSTSNNNDKTDNSVLPQDSSSTNKEIGTQDNTTGKDLLYQDIETFIIKPAQQFWSSLKSSPQAVVDWWNTEYSQSTEISNKQAHQEKSAEQNSSSKKNSSELNQAIARQARES